MMADIKHWPLWLDLRIIAHKVKKAPRGEAR